MMLQQNLKSNGFTIVELIIVVVIMGVIAAIAIPNYNKSVAATNQKIAKNNVSIMMSAENIKKLSDGNYLACASTSSCNSNLNTNIVASNDSKYFCNTYNISSVDYAYCNATIISSQSIVSASNSGQPCCCGRYWMSSNPCSTIPSCGASCMGTLGIVEQSVGKW